MVEIDKIEQLATEQGKSLSFISLKLNHGRGYLKDKKLHNSAIDENTLTQIADILGTTTDYLHGKTDKKEKSVLNEENGLSDMDSLVLSLFNGLAPEQKKKALARLFELSKDAEGNK